MPDDEGDWQRVLAIPGMNVKVGAPPKGTVGPKLSDVMDAEDADIQRILENLRQQQSDWDHTTGMKRDPRERREAELLFLELREHADQARGRREAEAQQARDRAIAEEKNRLDEERNRISAGEIEGRLALEQQRVEIEKAKVIVDAFVRIGSDPAMRAQFSPMLEALSQRLLTGASVGMSDGEVTKLRLISSAAKPNGDGK